MPDTYKVLDVAGPRQWEGQYGVSYDWQLGLEGPNGVPLPHPAILTTKKPDNGPSVGEALLLDVGPHPKLENRLKAKRVQDQQPQGAGGRRPSDPKERASIEAQVAAKIAGEVTVALASAEKLELVGKAEFRQAFRVLANEAFEVIHANAGRE